MNDWKHPGGSLPVQADTATMQIRRKRHLADARPGSLRRLFRETGARSGSLCDSDGQSSGQQTPSSSGQSTPMAPGSPAAQAHCAILRGEHEMADDASLAMLLAAEQHEQAVVHQEQVRAQAYAANAALHPSQQQHLQDYDSMDDDQSSGWVAPSRHSGAATPNQEIPRRRRPPAAHSRAAHQCNEKVLCGQCKFCEEVLGRLLHYWQDKPRADQRTR